MIKDPSANGAGPSGPARPSPYELLAPAGVTPWTSHKDMQDVSFELLARHLMTPVTQQAWDELRGVRRRLLVDLLHYDVDLAAELPSATEEIDRALAAGPDPLPRTDAHRPDDLTGLTDLIRFDV
ncbi:hypothetical protein ABZV77_02390 [Streptomyces sp. NPDC004732]|uniref:hypothetical protein n=1 Tax=Streptomyces sp. NPDC004732 TaxID=3154290 RepID=UPI0033B354F9